MRSVIYNSESLYVDIQIRFESHHSVRNSENSITTSISTSSHYVKDRFLPDKAIDLIDASEEQKLPGNTFSLHYVVLYNCIS